MQGLERMRLRNMDRTQQSALDRAMASVARTEAAMAALACDGADTRRVHDRAV